MPRSEVDRGVFTYRKLSRQLRTRETCDIVYWGIFGHIETRRKTTSLKGAGHKSEEVISQEEAVTLVPSLIYQGLEFRYCKSFGQMSRSLSYFPVLSSDAEVFTWCTDGNIGRFKDALSHREISPFVRDERGKSLLHHASEYCRIEFCTLLIHLGIDADHMALNGKKAMHEPWGHLPQHEVTTDTLRVLTAAQDDVTLDDVSLFCLKFYGPVGAADFLLSTHAFPADINLGADMQRPPLSLALREYVQGRREWGLLIRKLLRFGADVHAERSDFFRSEEEKWAPLDELFDSSDDPFSKDNIAQEWLSMLAEAGYDTKAYLERERRIRDHDNERYRRPYRHVYKSGKWRQLFFELDDDGPNIHWDWWVDLSSAASLVFTEFLHLNLHHKTLTDDCYDHSWESTFPFVYPSWSEACQPWWRPLYEKWCEEARLAQNRLDRRARKKYPEHYNCTRKPSFVPGAWIDED
ncbi:MAG: hypothetical protein Q9222_002008 [Ikaeria aurantiellina]